VEEWWALELEKVVENLQNVDQKIRDYIANPFECKPTADEAIEISLNYNIPLHPSYIDFWGNISVEELDLLRKAFISNFSIQNDEIILENTKEIKDILEKAFVLHVVKDNKIIFKKAMNNVYKFYLISKIKN